jgi:hypothetical protein
MAKVSADAGKAFDPKIVAILRRRYIELEKMANEQPLQAPPKLSTDIKVERGLAPAAGFAESAEPSANPHAFGRYSRAYISAVHRARTELLEFIRQFRASLRGEDILSLLAVRLKALVPYDSLAVYCPENGMLVARFVSGENFRMFSSLRIPDGEGLSGWVAQNHKAILNGNPSVEPGYMNGPRSSALCARRWLCLSKELPALLCWRFIARSRMHSHPRDLHVVEALSSGA